jgi:hypothetical protein
MTSIFLESTLKTEEALVRQSFEEHGLEGSKEALETISKTWGTMEAGEKMAESMQRVLDHLVQAQPSLAKPSSMQLWVSYGLPGEVGLESKHLQRLAELIMLKDMDHAHREVTIDVLSGMWAIKVRKKYESEFPQQKEDAWKRFWKGPAGPVRGGELWSADAGASQSELEFRAQEAVLRQDFEAHGLEGSANALEKMGKIWSSSDDDEVLVQSIERVMRHLSEARPSLTKYPEDLSAPLTTETKEKFLNHVFAGGTDKATLMINVVSGAYWLDPEKIANAGFNVREGRKRREAEAAKTAGMTVEETMPQQKSTL